MRLGFVVQDPHYAPGTPNSGVPNTYFPARHGNRVALYKDAHCAPGRGPQIRLANGSLFKEQDCWNDLYSAICAAQQFIYICGAHQFSTPSSRGAAVLLKPSLAYAVVHYHGDCIFYRLVQPYAGWSVYDKVTLCRDPTKPMEEGQWPSIGNLLKSKAAEGVRVLLLIWDDKTSLDGSLGINTSTPPAGH